MAMVRMLAVAGGLAVAAGAAAAADDWTVAAEDSRVSFVSVKSGDFAEVHHFPTVTGSVAPDGTARVRVPLDSVETLIDIRNERMREHLFETATYPYAEITAQLDLSAFEALEVGERTTADLSATIDLHGAQAPIAPQVYVTRAGADRVVVETVDPIILFADDFGFLPGLEVLRELAGLPSITPTVPVTFSVVFDR